ncbi:MAG: glycerol-3-phosphate 1-O-acyltransferase PlsY [Erysipelotrichaceae bacterium]|nr:glycerol-3-phosphate 1-O-acyltransferase PlsY [Erysipelotrichaceae bacterium]
MTIFMTIVWIIIGYLIGSIPWALIIGKVFYKKDIRQFGSGNLGGSNAGRVLGKKAGVAVIVLDALKAFLVMCLTKAVTPEATAYAGLAVCIGHCFPVFAQFKGGKAVACSYGYLLALGLFVTGDAVFSFVYPVLMFFLVLGLTRMVSLSSMVSLVFETVIGFLTFPEKKYAVMVLLLTGFVIIRHIPNILRIIKGKESKVSWIS